MKRLAPHRRGLVLLLLLLVSLPLSAQQERWQQLDSQAKALFQQGKFDEGIPVAREALRVAEAAFGANDLRVATSANDLGDLDDAAGSFAEAESAYQRALAIREKVLGPEHPDVAETLNGMAGLYADEGRLTDAEPVFQRALRIREKALGPDDPRLAKTLSDLGMLKQDLGHYAEAERLWQRALRIREKALGPDHRDVAMTLNNLGSLYRDEGRYQEAEPMLQRALQIWEKALGPDHPDLSLAVGNLANLYSQEGKDAQAEALYQRALRMQEKALGPDHPYVGITLNNLGTVYQDEGKVAEARSCYERALGIDEKALGPDHPGLGVDLDNLAYLYQSDRQYAQAESLYQRGLRIREKALGPEHPDVAQSLSDLGDLRFAQGLPEQAQPLYLRDFDILFHQFEELFAYMSETERLAFLGTVSNRFPTYYSFVHRFREKKPELIGSMYDLLLWEKGFVAGSETALRRQVEASGDAEALKLLDRLGAKRAQLAALINAQPDDLEAWRKQVEQGESEANELEKALVARSSAFAQQKKLERATWQQVRGALKPGEAAVEFARFADYDGTHWGDATYYVALVVTPETKDHPAYVVLGEAKQLEGAPLLEFQQQVQARGGPSTGPATRPALPAYQLFWKPLAGLLGGATRVYLSADGVLNQMPLGLVRAPDGRLLMEKYDLRLVSSTKDLLRAAPAPAANTAVLVGDPKFDLGAEQQRAALQKLGTPPQSGRVQMAMLAPRQRSRDQGEAATLPPLPGSGIEVAAVSQLLRQHRWETSAYTADRALEEAVKQARSPRLLHLATHGFFLPDQQTKARKLGGARPAGLEDPMLRSGLYFAGADRALAGQATPDDLDDGVLTAYEATGLNLQGTELVVLSACNTGQGEVKNGEGVFGLRRALQEAGAQAVMMSLWSVPDKETQELMTHFYRKWLAGMEKHEALRQAELEERAVVRKRYGRDLPYYWGAFVLVGR